RSRDTTGKGEGGTLKDSLAVGGKGEWHPEARDAWQQARAVAGGLGARAARRTGGGGGDRGHQDARRRRGGPPPARARREGVLHEGDRGGPARAADRRGGAFAQGPANPSRPRPRARRGSRARGPARCAGDPPARGDVARRTAARAGKVAAERSVLAALGGGCQAPVAAYAGNGEGRRGMDRLYGRVTARDGAVQITASADVDPADPAAAGVAVADLLGAQGALE